MPDKTHAGPDVAELRPEIGASSSSTPRRWRRTAWIFLARVLVIVGTLTSVAAAVITLRHGDLTGLAYVGFVFMQPVLYKAMTYGL